jgi:hypothetical protein
MTDIHGKGQSIRLNLCSQVLFMISLVRIQELDNAAVQFGVQCPIQVAAIDYLRDIVPAKHACMILWCNSCSQLPSV